MDNGGLIAIITILMLGVVAFFVLDRYHADDKAASSAMTGRYTGAVNSKVVMEANN